MGSNTFNSIPQNNFVMPQVSSPNTNGPSFSALQWKPATDTFEKQGQKIVNSPGPPKKHSKLKEMFWDFVIPMAATFTAEALFGPVVGCITGAFSSAGMSYHDQLKDKGHVNWSKVFVEGALGAIPFHHLIFGKGGVSGMFGNKVEIPAHLKDLKSPHIPISSIIANRFRSSDDPLLWNFHKIDSNESGFALFRGAMPHKPDAMAQLKNEHKADIMIDFRTQPSSPKSDFEFEQGWAKHLDMKYHNIPLESDTAPTETQIKEFLQIVRKAKANNQKVFIHCKQGIDRTGAFSAAYDVIEKGKTPEQAYSDMVKYGYNSSHQAKRPQQAEFVKQTLADRRYVKAVS